MRFEPGFLGGGPSPHVFTQVVTYSTFIADTVAKTTYTFAATTVGTASTDRLIVVAAHAGGVGLSSLASCTINSSPATIVVQAVKSLHVAALFQMALPTTETAVDIGLTWASSTNGAQIGVYVVTGLASQTASTFGNAISNTSVRTVTLNRPDGGVGIAAVSHFTTQNMTWTAPFTEVYEVEPVSPILRGGATLSAAASGSVNAQVTGPTTNGKTLVAAIWA